ncbi:MAG TPA: hypothetical protein VJ888_09185 [Mobilitalea sp.]|nr:hypothetical protein [Mobilitalea sp.]
MLKTKLLKGFALGLCMSALFTGAAFASSTGEGSSPSFEGQMDQGDTVLYDKQLEIDRYLFADHVEEIESKGIIVIYTGVAEGYVEIGVAGLKDETANYLYDLFGKDIVKIVEAEEVTIMDTPKETYTSDVVPDNQANTTTVAPDDQVYTTMDDADGAAVDMDLGDDIYTTMDEEVKSSDYAADVEEQGLDGKVYKSSDDAVVPDIDIQEATDLDNPEIIYHTTAVEDGLDEGEVKAVSVDEDNVDELKRTVDDKAGLPVPVIILIVAGGATLIGGAILISNKNKLGR